MLAESLRDIKVKERKRCCGLIAGYVAVMDKESDVLGISWDEINSSKEALRAIAGDTDNVGDTEDVISKSKPKEIDQIREARKTGYYDATQMAYLQDTLRMSTLNIGDLNESPTGTVSVRNTSPTSRQDLAASLAASIKPLAGGTSTRPPPPAGGPPTGGSGSGSAPSTGGSGSTPSAGGPPLPSRGSARGTQQTPSLPVRPSSASYEAGTGEDDYYG